MDPDQLNGVMGNVNSLVARALKLNDKSILVKKISKVMLELAIESASTSKPTDLKKVEVELAKLTTPFKDAIRLRQMSESKKQNPYSQIEKICGDLEFGELIIKVQDGKPVFIESIKKQVKII